ncbi:MBL fold metallo-hydrolase [Gordonia polyisoprenivorans]|uniref:MBL fold metallo-hydrolase n=1 Tax=Gordonia polyisoprenivorans TaxID=84595 RepID=UPI001AD7D0F0|nr:MBL fold metallo-hydrolase [Gordonia polyisoprenivorans]QTI67499.1 MBL fold metallo-hydrolase [Gordonia polyisoprenivorans]
MYSVTAFGAVDVLTADNGGVLPYGNTVVVRGSDAVLVIDPSLALDDDPVGADAVMISHAHEDHIAGLRHFTADTFAHRHDAAAVGSLDTLIAGYGLDPEVVDAMTAELTDEYHLPAVRDGVVGVTDGHTFDLGDQTATVIHLPGHTAGHCGVLIEPAGFLYVADIDLTSFGPMYGDLGSSLEDYLASIDRVAEIDARWYGTFHHKGVVTGRPEFGTRLAAYRDRILEREDRLLEFLRQPRTFDEIVTHRLVYRPHVEAPWVRSVERRTAQLHLERLHAAGAVIAIGDGQTGLHTGVDQTQTRSGAVSTMSWVIA